MNEPSVSKHQGVEANREVIGEGVGAGEVEVDQPRHLGPDEEDVVGEEIRMDDAVRQPARPCALEMVELPPRPLGQSVGDGVGLRLSLPKSGAQASATGVGTNHWKILARQVRARALAEGRAMLSGGPTNRDAVEECDDGGGPPTRRPRGSPLRLLTGRGQLRPLRARCCGEREEEGQVRLLHPLLVEGQDVGSSGGVEKVVRVLHASAMPL